MPVINIGMSDLDLGHWTFPHDFDPAEWFGFIYRITEINTGREYVGKKQFFSNRTKVVAGRKNRKHYKKESDWRKYTGSSKELNLSIEATGMINYKFNIESLHKTKGSLHYREVVVQITEDVLRTRLPSGIRKFYNGHISSVKFIPADVHPDEQDMKI
jgi:hypothetical protein